MPFSGDQNKFSNIISSGNRLGMFDQATQYFGKDPSKWPQQVQEGIGYGFGLSFLRPTLEQEAASLEMQAAFQERMLKKQQELGKESVDYARTQKEKYDRSRSLLGMIERIPGQIASAINPMADPATAALVLGARQRGFEGQEAILRAIPGLQPAAFAMPSRNYFSSLG